MPENTDSMADQPVYVKTAAHEIAVKEVLNYHERTKHRFDKYAVGPATLDWDAQPAAFRHFAGSPSVLLPLVDELRSKMPLASSPQTLLENMLNRPFGTAIRDAAALDLNAIGALLNLAFGITAWKSLGPDRWAVRANPSSGNLHPIEAYIVASGIAGIIDGVHHYDPLSHSLDLRAIFAADALPEKKFFVGLTSIQWREAWKYGERAFRYCELDCGHAIGALNYAAKTLGWQLRERRDLSTVDIAALLGVDRIKDFPGKPATEGEEAESLLEIVSDGLAATICTADDLRGAMQQSVWHGVASTIDRHPLYRWPTIESVTVATRRREIISPARIEQSSEFSSCTPDAPAMADVILNRRSAQRFDNSYTMAFKQFQKVIAALIADSARLSFLETAPRIALVLFVQRVENIAQGIYLLPRSPRLAHELQELLPAHKALEPCPSLPALLQMSGPLTETQPFRRALRSLHCHQDIAVTACFAVGMLARFNAEITRETAAYRELFREAGMIGQTLYLEAEAIGLRGTGIGCYFDDPVHHTLELAGDDYQSLYHFTLGMPLHDHRIEHGEPYPARRSGVSLESPRN